MRRLALLALLAGSARAAEEPAPDPAVYTCRVVVTGSDARNRPAAVEQCVRDVLVKLSGDPALANAVLDPTDALETSIEDFAYLDLMSDMPLHDEQGTRDRPFDFVGHVNPYHAARHLRRLGYEPWVEQRPALLALVEISRNGATTELTADGPTVERQRQALLAAADRFAVRVRLPAEATPAVRWTLYPPPEPLIHERTVILSGTLTWDNPEPGWNAAWQLTDITDVDIGPPWSVAGVSFDAAFRAGVGGAAQRLAPSRPAGSAR